MERIDGVEVEQCNGRQQTGMFITHENSYFIISTIYSLKAFSEAWSFCGRKQYPNI